MTLPAPKQQWTFTNASGTTATDAVGGAQLTIDRESWRPGKFGRALRFNPQDGAMKVRTHLPDRAPPWTISMWVNWEAKAANGSSLFSSNTAALKLEQWGAGHVLGITKFSYGESGVGGDYTFGGATAKLGEWVHVTFVATVTETRLYLGGQLAGSCPVSMPLALDWLGSTRGSEEFASMLLDGIAVFDQALTAEQVAELHGSAQPGGDISGEPQLEVTQNGKVVAQNSTVPLNREVFGVGSQTSFVFTNKGSGVLHVQSVEIQGNPNFSYDTRDVQGKLLKKGESLEFKLNHIAKSLTSDTLNAIVHSNDPSRGSYPFTLLTNVRQP